MSLPVPAAEILGPLSKKEIVGTDGAVMAAEKKTGQSHYKGFVAGVFSGIAKLTG